jgi:hypothetical protein
MANGGHVKVSQDEYLYNLINGMLDNIERESLTSELVKGPET